MGLLFMDVKTENGSDMKLPYSQIEQKSIELNFQEKNGGESTIKINLNGKLSEITTTRRLTELVINSPWSLHKSTPKIRVTDMGNNVKTYEITCITFGENATKQLQELLLKEFDDAKK